MELHKLVHLFHILFVVGLFYQWKFFPEDDDNHFFKKND